VAAAEPASVESVPGKPDEFQPHVPRALGLAPVRNGRPSAHHSYGTRRR
jgi:hypothetical protein